jgi:hypothetical protein
MPGGELTIGRHGPGQQQHDAGAQTFATGGEQMLGGRLEDRVASADQAAQVGQKGIEIGLHRLEQLSNRCHITSSVARS